jgi:peroxiredoxin
MGYPSGVNTIPSPRYIVKGGKAMKRLLFISAIILSALTASPCLAGDILDDFSLTGLDGNIYDSETVEGRPLVVSVMAEWCTVCRRDSTELQKAYLSYKKRGVLFFGVFVKSDEQGIREFARANHLSFPVGEDSGIAEKLGAFSVPTTAFISKEGTMVKRHIGPVEYSRIIAGIEEILK